MVSILSHKSRNSDKYLEEAQYSGKLNLSNKKLRDIFYLSNRKYNLLDVTDVDLSNNGLQEVPNELEEWYCVTNLALACNGIRTIPNFFVNFCLLHTLDMSNNLLVNVPSFLSYLKNLMILRLQNNKIVGLPSEIGKLKSCQELDVSGNQIRLVPEEIGNMESLFHLDLSRNQVEALPESISKLPLIHLDISSNKITMVPLSYQNITSLKQFNVIENPLRMPSLHVLKYGRIHFFKALEADLANLHKRNQQPEVDHTSVRKISKEDSFDTVIERYSSAQSEHNDTIKPSGDLEAVFVENKPLDPVEAVEPGTSEEVIDVVVASTPKKKTLSREASSNSLSSQKLSSEGSKSSSPKRVKGIKSASGISKIRSKQSSPIAERPKTSPKRGTLLKQGNKIPPAPPALQLRTPKPIVVRKQRSIPLRTERKKSIGSPKRVVKDPKESQTSPSKKAVPKPKVQSGQTKLLQSKIASPSHTSSYPGYAPPQSSAGSKTPGDQTRFLNVIKPRKAHSISRSSKPKTPVTPAPDEGGFTIRRKTEKMYEELELIENIRGKIEAALKIRLANDLQVALSDGVILCQLANYIKPRSIPTIHVPSPAVPKLSLAKSRRNVEYFLEVCPRLGVKPKEMCTSNDIMHEKGLNRVVDTINSLLRNFSPSKSSAGGNSLSQPSVKVVSSFLHGKKA